MKIHSINVKGSGTKEELARQFRELVYLLEGDNSSEEINSSEIGLSINMDKGYDPEDFRLVEEWDEHIGISWWKACRTKLNVVIRLYNNWQTEKGFDPAEGRILIAHLKNCKEEMPENGGSGYIEEIDNMIEFVEETIKKS